MSGLEFCGGIGFYPLLICFVFKSTAALFPLMDCITFLKPIILILSTYFFYFLSPADPFKWKTVIKAVLRECDGQELPLKRLRKKARSLLYILF